MGRPISKRFLGDAEGAIKVSHYRRSTGNEVAGEDDTYIKSQKSTNKFVVADTSGDWSETLTLVDKAAGSLAAGEFRISATDPEGDAAHVSRLYNRTLRIGDGQGEKRKVGWDIEASDSISVTGVTRVANEPVKILVSDTSYFEKGDVVKFSGIMGTTVLNDNNDEHTFTVGDIVEDASFTLAGTNALGSTPTFGAFAPSPNGKVFVTGKAAIDRQDN